MGTFRDRMKARTAGGGGSKDPQTQVPLSEPRASTPSIQSSPVAPAATKGDTHSYERDLVERKDMESRKFVMKRETILRVRFGRVLTSKSPQTEDVHTKASDGCEDHVDGYVWGLGKRPAHTRGALSLVGAKKNDGDDVYGQLEEFAPKIERRQLDLELGPYAEKDGQMARFVESVLKGVKDSDLHAIIERLIDTRPVVPEMAEAEFRFPRQFKSGYNFTYNDDLMTPDELPTAGRVLSQEGRNAQNDVTGATEFTLVHPLESYMLAVSALRRRGYPAYIAQAVTPAPNKGEEMAPLIAIVDLTKEVPLTTFDLLRFHPAAGAVDILTDTAVKGGTFAMLAEARVKHLTTEMKIRHGQGKPLSAEEIGRQLERVTYSIAQCSELWYGTPFIKRVTIYLFNDLTNALLSMDQNMALPDQGAGVIPTPAGMRPLSYAEAMAHRMVQNMQHALGRMLKDAKPEPEISG